jgi:hypothetical protein
MSTVSEQELEAMRATVALDIESNLAVSQSTLNMVRLMCKLIHERGQLIQPDEFLKAIDKYEQLLKEQEDD